MKLSRKSIRFPSPVRHVRLRSGAFSTDGRPANWENELRAAFEKGRLEGEQSLGQQLIQQRNETRQILQGVVESLRKAVPSVVHDAEQQLVALSLEIAQKLVADCPITAEVVEAAVRDALGEVEGNAECHVRLHPADLELLRQHDSEFIGNGDASQPLQFHTSPEVTRGGCLVQTRFGIIDARRETKMDLLKRSLLG